MEIEYKGASGLVIKVGQTVVVVDPRLSNLGLKDIKVKDAIELVTEDRFGLHDTEKLYIGGPGEYEVATVSIKGIAAQRHLDAEGKRSTIYKITAAGYRMAIIGHINEQLSEQQLEEIGVVDIVVVPVGGNGYTLDGHGAAKVIRQIDPRVVIPVHYADKAITYEVPQNELELFTKDMGTTPHEVVEKYKLKIGGNLPEVLTVVELQRSA
jgi:L-ascorbate metabolism protein UlaG (beta-lactamase superfamily)